MNDFGDATYGDRIADLYDEWYPPDTLGGVDATVEFLSAFADGGMALELGIGTGRVAIPLAATGATVRGIDASAAMVAKLHAKDPAIQVTLGTFADFSLAERFSLVYVVFNTFFALTTEDEQASCMRAIARHLTPGGVFVMTTFVPDPARFHRGQRVGVTRISVDEVTLEASKVDPSDDHRIESVYVVLTDGQPVRVLPVRIRYAYPAELDVLAEGAGLRLRERWADWDRTPFDAASKTHVSVWERQGS